MVATVSTLLASTQAFQETGTLAICIIIVCVHQNIQDKNVKVCYLTNKEACAVYYTEIKQDGHLRIRGKRRKNELQASVFFISRVYSNDWSQCFPAV